MSAIVRCRCCGCPCDGEIRRQVKVCIGCDDCDRLHGAQLQGVLFKAVSDGKLDPYAAIARSLIDDAQLSGRLVYVIKNGRVADLWIPAPVPRWLVCASRMVVRGEMPDMQSVVDAALARFIKRKNNATTLAEMKSELLEALRFMDEAIFDVDITAAMDTLEPGHLVIKVSAKTPTIGAVVAGSDVDIPADVLTRKHAEA